FLFFCLFVCFFCVSRISCNVYCLQKLKNVVHSDKLLFCQALAAAQSLISQVISSSLKALGKLINVARAEFITELFSHEPLSGEIPPKQVRLDSSDSWKDVQQELTVRRVDSDMLALVLSQRLRDSRWEVKDSSLEFVPSLLQVNHDSLHEFLCRHSIHLKVWNATDDADSYVRATAIHVIGSLVCQSQLWISLLQISHLTEESILQKFLSVLENDDEAFPRIRVIEYLSLWVKARHPIVKKHLQLGKPYHQDSANATGRSRGSFGKYECTNEFEIARVVCHTCQNRDWEAKLRGLEFWEAVIDSFISFQGSREKAILMSKASVEEEMDVENMKELFQLLFDMGALSILNEVLNDCDVMVCEKALEILASLRNIVNPEGIFNEQSIKTSWEFQESLGKSFDLKQFKEVLRSADFLSLTQSTEAADSSVRSDLVSFIKDIILAASHQDENLLDCY
ncbi:integrator complex assembly factor BRAT1-like, partial [Acropora palmata]|uniref:integrator complex assembly factor BRAT1-like n=1 Tax=Acropora palmata TaxID=6131 RepID=UPI003DA0B172